jgi:ribosomal protein L34
MRRLRDRPRCHGQLHAFNTAAGEKINADNRLKGRSIGLSVSGYGKISL